MREITLDDEARVTDVAPLSDEQAEVERRPGDAIGAGLAPLPPRAVRRGERDIDRRLGQRHPVDEV